ncbi:hypothetical protein [Romboutsia sp.]|uniref:hypothetical protein n=1 Tax=Romboutsia sp. TaxID=1965302 RepID=UPI003F336FEE
MNFSEHILDATATFLETKARFFMDSNSKEESKKRKLYLSTAFVIFVTLGIISMLAI